MIEQAIDLWEVEADVRVITTNGTVNGGKNVMGGGCAREAADREPGLPLIYGRLLQRYGNHVYLIPGRAHPDPLVMFPVKHEVWLGADPVLIANAANELRLLTELYEWKRVALPRPGCGLGGLKWDDVKSVLESIGLDDRFIIIDYPEPVLDPEAPTALIRDIFAP